MTNDQIIYKGQLSENILNDETFKQAITNVEERITNEWKSATTQEQREMCHHKLGALTAIQIELQIPVLTKNLLIQNLANQSDGTQ